MFNKYSSFYEMVAKARESDLPSNTVLNQQNVMSRARISAYLHKKNTEKHKTPSPNDEDSSYFDDLKTPRPPHFEGIAVRPRTITPQTRAGAKHRPGRSGGLFQEIGTDRIPMKQS